LEWEAQADQSVVHEVLAIGRQGRMNISAASGRRILGRLFFFPAESLVDAVRES
jgi:hypothetical protein